MANSREIILYKQQIASVLVNDDEIVRLLNDTDIETPDELIGKRIFNFMRYPFAVEEEVSYIAFEVEIPKYNNVNKLFKKLMITFYVVSHERLMPTDDPLGGTRNDLLAARIDKLFNGYRGIGKTPLELISNTADAVSVKHRRRILVFYADDINASGCA